MGELDSPTEHRNTSEPSGDDMPAWAREAIEAALTADEIVVNMPPQSGAPIQRPLTTETESVVTDTTPPTQVYIVTSGNYSDYHIVSVWLTHEEAKAAADTWDHIEVYAVGDNKRTLGSFSHSCDIDIHTGEVTEQDPYEYADVAETGRTAVLWWPGDSGFYKDKLGVRVTADTAERAAKVYSETKARVLAELSQGLPPEIIADHKYAGPGDQPWVPTDRLRGPLDPQRNR